MERLLTLYYYYNTMRMMVYECKLEGYRVALDSSKVALMREYRAYKADMTCIIELKLVG